MHPDKMLTTAEVAGQADCHVSTVTRAVSLSELRPSFRAPGAKGAMWFEAAEAARWIATRHRAKAEASAS